MRKTLGLCLGLAASVLFLPAVSAQAVLQEEQEMSVAAAATMEPLDYSFLEAPASGKLELYDLRSVESGSVLTMYLDTERGPIWLQLRFDGGYVEAWLPHRQQTLWRVPVSSVSRKTPLTTTLQDGQLVVAVGGASAILDDIKAFQGVFTTQGVSGRMKVYSWQESGKKRLLLA